MTAIVGVRFERAGRVHYFDSGGLTVKVNDYVVAESDGEQKVGRVVISPNQVVINQLREALPNISRLATVTDMGRFDKDQVKP